MKFQNFKFNTIQEMLDTLPDDQKQIVDILRELIFETIPGVKEKLSYNVPFYKVNQNICLIWPGAVPWGKKLKDGVELAFNKGNLLPEPNFLEKGNRKYVYNKIYYSISEIDTFKVRELLTQAAEIDELVKERK